MPEVESPSLPDLFESQELTQIQRRKRRRRHGSHNRWLRHLRRRIGRYNWRVLLLAGLGIIAAIGMSGVLLAVSARDKVYDSWERLDRTWYALSDKPGTELTLNDFERLERGVNDFSASLSSARRQMIVLRPLAFASGEFSASWQALEAAQHLSLAANNMLVGIKPAIFFLTEGGQEESVVAQISSGERVVELLGLGRRRFMTAGQELDLAQSIITDLSHESVSPDLIITIDSLSKFLDQLQDINQTLLDSPTLLTAALGLEDDQTYLVLSQNSDELRPSGGYISTYGWITVRNGRVVDYDYYPSTATSPNPPPVEMSSEVPVPEWWIPYEPAVYAAWDGSWYADFPSTAAMSAWYYDQGDNPQSPVDGVIAIDLAGFEYLLKGLGGITVEQYGVDVSGENFREKIYEIRADHSDDINHKQFLAALYRQIFQDWQSVDSMTAIDMRGAALQALQEKHIMIYFTNQELNRAMDVLGWLGAQEPGTANDYLMVVDANLGNKANRSVNRQLTYDVEIQPDRSLKSRLAIGYDYSARVAENDPAVGPQHGSINYNSLIQVMVPAGATLTGTNEIMVEPTVVLTDEHTIFVSNLTLDYNESRRFQYSYTAPALVENAGAYWRYKLVIQKQPGMLGEFVNVQVTLPEGAEVISVTPAAAASYSLEKPIVEFRIELISDEEIEIIFDT